MATLTVGVGKEFGTIGAAVAASRNGDIIQVQAGTYKNDFATINTRITIEGIGGMVNLVATVPPPNGKAILVTNTDVTLRNLSFSGAKVADGNGAGIRYQGGNLDIENCLFTNNQDGLLAAASPTGSITINNSEFSHNGTGDGYTHNIYVGEVGSLTITNSYIHDAVVGHEIKSRALKTVIENNRIVDGPTGSASYDIDLPNGGNALISGNIIEKGPASQNPAMIHFGGEGTAYAGSSLTITNNTLLYDHHASSATALLNQTGVTASLTNNKVFGLTAATLTKGPATSTATTYLTTEPTYSTASPINVPVTPSTLSLQLSYGGAKIAFIATLDGKPLAAAQTVTVAHNGAAGQTFSFTGAFALGAHTLVIESVAAARATGDLYVGGITYNAIHYTGPAAGILAGHADTFVVGR